MVVEEKNALIVDANVFRDLRPEIKDAIINRNLKIIISKKGLLESELRTAKKTLFREYKRQKKFYDTICNESVERKMKHLEYLKQKQDLLCSDDAHIIALAIVSGANVLVTEDQKLIDDFGKCNDIDRQSECTSRERIRRKVIKKTSPKDSNVVKGIIRNAEVRYKSCQHKTSGCFCTI